MTAELNIKFSTVGFDIDVWYLFHPEDLNHRCQDPPFWCTEDFAASKEFAAGRLIAFRTVDGISGARLTNQGLTEREQTYVRGSAEFRLRVQHARLCIAEAIGLPSADRIQPEEAYAFDYGWIPLPNGDYRVTVYGIAWFEELGARDEDGNQSPQALTSYVIDFQSVASLEEISSPTSIPTVSPGLRPIFNDSNDSDSLEAVWLADEEYTEPLAPEYPLLYWYEVIFPGIKQDLDLSTSEEPFELMDWQVVISYSIDDQAIGTLFQAESIPRQFREGRWHDLLRGMGKQLIRLSRVFEKNEVWWVEVEPYEPPSSFVDQGAIDRLKQLFADYAEKDAAYQRRVQFYRFYAERVASLTNPRELGWFIAHASDFNGDQQQALLPLSDASLVEELTHALETRLGE